MDPTIEFFDRIREILSGWLTFSGSHILISLLMLVVITLAAVSGYYLTVLILHLVARVVELTETDWDDDLINDKLLHSISQLTPAIVVAWMLPICFETIGTFAAVLHVLTSFYIIAVSVYAVNTFLDNLLYAFSRRPRFRPYAVTGIFQMGKLIVIGIGVIIAVSLLVGKSPIAILTALGASAAILMLVFKDTIMGLVASVQLSANKMLRKGDWVIVPKHNANGEVVEISLTTVKIRNWDNSITTVPPYSLVSDSFQNFRAMRMSGARRVSRAIYIDFNSIRYLTPAELASLDDDGMLDTAKIAPATTGEMPVSTASTDKASSRPLDKDSGATDVNLSLFRNYLETWISTRPEVRSDLIYMVRQLEPTPEGLPLELYFFVKIIDWKPFEHLQSAIFDHVYAVAPRFGLRIFQTPSGRDLTRLLTSDAPQALPER